MSDKYDCDTTIVSGIICKKCKNTLPPMTMTDHLEGNFNLECPHTPKMKKIDYFLNFYRMEKADNINDFEDDDIEVQLLNKFVDNFLYENDYTNIQTRFFDVIYFIQTCMDDGYDVYINKGGIYKELNQKEIALDYVWMTQFDGRAKCMTEYDMFIVKSD